MGSEFFPSILTCRDTKVFENMNHPIVIVSLIAVVLGVVIYCLRSRPAVEMIVEKSEILRHSGWSKHEYLEAKEFFAKHFAETDRIHILAYRQANRLQYSIRGDLDPGQVQQIRNFLVNLS